MLDNNFMSGSAFVPKGRRTLGAKRVNDIFPKSVEELVGSYFRGGEHGKCVYVPQIVRNVPIWYIFGRTHT